MLAMLKPMIGVPRRELSPVSSLTLDKMLLVGSLALI
jgi:hypothetical protein